MYSASTALLEALGDSGVTHIFANFGSDHPALVEAIAEARAHGRAIPMIVTSPNEMVALSCAHGSAQLTGQAQAVIVHVECGTQALGGAVHNAAKARVPAFIFAGLSPFTQEGELRGSRNEFIQWIQDVADQRGIVRGYMKYSNEFRTGKNIPQLVRRAMQLAHSDPKGPVYLTGAREVMEEEITPVAIEPDCWRPLPAAPLPEASVAEIAAALATAKRPLIVTTYLGRKPEAVHELVRLCERLGVGVLESVPTTMNYPHDAAMYQGNHWNHPFQNQRLAEADVVLVIDSDVPWIPTINRPAESARIFHIDIDPLKDSIPLWYIKAHRSFRADAATALAQINAHLGRAGWDEAAAGARIQHYVRLHDERAKQIEGREAPDGDTITPEFLTAAVRRAIDADTVILNEGITNYPAICDHIARTKPGTFFASGGGSLGWNGGAAVGMKLAAPERTFVALTGDGSYMFSIPSTVHWMARRYKAPFLQVVYNNRGWKAPKYSALAVHPDGYAARADDIDVSFEPPPDYAGIAAAAGGAFVRTVKSAGDLDEAIREALRAVREGGRAAVLDVWLPAL
ncbi:thiamine pyrophosphate-requiring protein [Methylocapsa sp. S129]|uniref:thiamine pyrophosphate-requiring protein n=1 Tax=Methylocapsa sp. S129 TaxID=1641869 RepID=UPI00131DE8A9|nr:thiamine pyrophosphate-requiring protein [Methylocapsa sp. S129]